MDEIILGNIMVPSWIILPAFFIAWVSGLFVLKKILFGTVRKLTAKTRTRIDDILISAADLPLTLLIFGSGAAVMERLIPYATHAGLTNDFLVAFKAVTVVAIVLFTERALTRIIYEYADKVEILKSSGGIVRGFMRLAVIGIGLLVLLDSFGVSVTPVLASLGIGSLAVALALQPTLENLFAGIQIVIDKPIHVGHFIKLESGEEGYVHKIGWRSTWVRLLSNNIVILSNKNLVNSKITNYYYPDKELAVLVEVSVHYQSDLEMVERVTVEEAKKVMREVAGGVPVFEPFVRYHTFGESGVGFTVILRAREFTDAYLIKHEFIKRLHQRFAGEGIVIPYPVRAVNYEQEKAARK
ncbi:MAG: mechanosensitive ion channel [Candidatus Omnitrophica bacterium]|nr:mechanosensitive ion channel [Candidatus Omnitrophota bacterium]